MTKNEAIQELADAFAKAVLDAANVGGVVGAALMASQVAMFRAGVSQILRDQPVKDGDKIIKMNKA